MEKWQKERRKRSKRQGRTPVEVFAQWAEITASRDDSRSQRHAEWYAKRVEWQRVNSDGTDLDWDVWDHSGIGIAPLDTFGPQA